MPAPDLRRDGFAARGRRLRWARVLLVLAFALVLARTAWVCDDAYITFRTSWNLVEGFGARWNVAERVQTFTNPLWMLVVALGYGATGDVVYTALALSIAISLAAFGLVVARAGGAGALLAGLALLLSRAFVDYSTSGLENPLTHLLLALFVLELARREREGASPLHALLLASLLAVNRLDTLALTAPASAVAVARAPRASRLGAVVLGATPLLLWLAFAWFYYGFPLPNTAQAKAFDLGIPRGTILAQGVAYLRDSLERDPITLVTIAGALVVLARTGRAWALALAAGVILHLAYVVWVGGDFMSGRMLAAPLLVAALGLALFEPWRRARTRWLVAGAGVALGLLPAEPGILTGPGFDDTSDASAVVDERAFYFQETGLWSERRRPGKFPMRPDEKILGKGRHLVVAVSIGRLGFRVGPRCHVVDLLGITDPLLARLPAVHAEGWRPGHSPRAIPPDHLRTLATGELRVRNEDLAAFLGDLRLVTRGPLASVERLRAVARFALGANRERLERWVASPEARARGATSLDRLGSPLPDGVPWHDPRVRLFVTPQLLVELGSRTHARGLELSVEASDDAYVALVDGDEVLHVIPLPRATEDSAAGLLTRSVPVPRRFAERGYDRLAIGGNGIDGIGAVGHLLLDE